MGHNPLAELLEQKNGQLEELRRRRAELVSDLDWHRAFDRTAAEEAVETHQARCAALEAEKGDVNHLLASGRKEGEELRDKARLGFNPAYWFSTERHTAWKRGAELHLALVDLEAREQALTDQLSGAQKALRFATQTLAKFDGIRVGPTEAEISAIAVELQLCQVECDNLAERKQALDRRLEEPVKVLEGLQDDERRALRERSSLARQIDDFESDIDRASRFDRELSNAANGYERHKIHEECEERLGDGSPRAIMSNRRRKLIQAKRELESKDRQLEGIRRNITKAENRVVKVADLGSRDVKALVVDGSNLCYQGDKFVRLAALRALCTRLVAIYDVTVVFDASIRHKLGVTDSALRDALPGVTVHVVATKTKADETVLAVAEDPYVFVLSNDRFSEYREKPAVAGGRLIRHEIINGRILVPDLDISASFAAEQ